MVAIPELIALQTYISNQLTKQYDKLDRVHAIILHSTDGSDANQNPIIMPSEELQQTLTSKWSE